MYNGIPALNESSSSISTESIKKKNAPLRPQLTAPLQSSSLLEPRYALTVDTSMQQNSNTSAAVSSWAYSSVQPVSATHTIKDGGPTRVVVANNYSCSSTESPSITWLTCETTDQENHVPSLHVHEVMPDFAQVSSFLGSVFDPNTSCNLQKLKVMDPIDVKTVLLLMKNLFINLTRPEFEPHVTLIMLG